MAIYIPLDKALESCDKIAKGFRENEIKTHIKCLISPQSLSYIIGLIASKYGKYIQEDGDIAFTPQIMPESSDPKGSIRYRCYIINEKIPTDSEYHVEFPDDPSTSNSTIFRVLEYSDEFSEKSYVGGNGIVLKESDGNYSWWFNDISKGEQLC